MANSTALHSNITQVSVDSNKNIESLRMAYLILLVLCFCIFLYFPTIILCVYFTTAHIRENTRYVLFVYMLINDTLYLILGFFLVVFNIYVINLPVPLCIVLVTLASISFMATPYYLAVMSLERYVAICYPLRHAQLCTTQRSHAAIAIIWAVGFSTCVADFIALSSSVETKSFSLSGICGRATWIKTQVQNTIKSIIFIFSFTMVGLIIVYTYIRIMLIARKLSSNKSSAFKAGKTVILHAFQLLLCMSAFTSHFTEIYLKDYFAFFPITNFLLFMCLPRFLSPLIYGIRDEVFRKYIIKWHSSAITLG
ncbi:odorant receptor 131-2-like [Ascaphus truei]|uniref:odorant receptor 131-2-like n=1 Tax=Ascaphus truei TaxID=8439 RepID=UPI003F592E97